MFKKITLALLLLPIFLLLSCDNGSTNNADPRYSHLNGTWIGEFGEIRLNNGNWEQLFDGAPVIRGVFTINNGNFTSITTHVHSRFFDVNPDGAILNLTPGWLNQWQLLEAYSVALQGIGRPDLLPNAAEFIDELFATSTSTYSITGNTLTMIDICPCDFQGETTILIRRS